MYRIVSKLLIYGDMPEDSILMQLSDVFRQMDEQTQTREVLVSRVFTQVKRLLRVATDYGFDGNLWHNYLTYLLITDENPFSITCEKTGASEGSVNFFAKGDFKAFQALFNFDFSDIEQRLEIDCFTRLTHYQAIEKKELMYNRNVSTRVQILSKELEETADEDEFFDVMTRFYKEYGVGQFGLNKAFRIVETESNRVEFMAVNNLDNTALSDLIGYEIQKKKLVDNTKAFVEGRKANNCLLFGDSGTGKSTCIKAIINAYYDKGLRMIEINKYQFRALSKVIAQIKKRNYKFIIYMDDLSFEQDESEYKFLKAVIEGGLETKPDNILIYATSNRRHLIRETWNDRGDVEYHNEIHHSDTMEEKNSLVNRFGVQISFSKPSKFEFNQIVVELARRQGIEMDEEKLCAEANKWELSHGGLSGRTAQQFINYVRGTLET